MKKGWIVFIVIIVLIILVLGWLGLIPWLSSVFGANKPKDLGIRYTQEDFNKAREKSAIAWEAISTDGAEGSVIFSGSHDVSTSWDSAQMTSLLNDRPWKYWPISDVQLRINPDNTVEMSGVFSEKKLEGYGAAIGVPQVVIDRLPILPANAAFYLKGTGKLTDNSVSEFNITSAKMNRISIPTGLLLGINNAMNAQTAYAEDLTSELGKYSDKKSYVVDFINSKLSWVSGFFAKRAEFKDGKLEFDGKLPDKENTSR